MVDDKSSSTRVTILGETYNIRHSDPEYTQRVAEYVNRLMHSIKKSGLQDARKIAILAAMSITDDLFQSREAYEKKCDELERKCNSLIDLIESSLDRNETEEVFSG
ncbi:MAG: cell division protein ZapA [Gemmatimonadota bacterium]|nr:cell division protein ZapA [Gemmatimonadota bacterium]